MRTPVLLLLTTTLALSACQSRWNPSNWWGKDRESQVQTETNALIPEKTEDGRSFFQSQETAEYRGLPIDKVTSVEVHKVTEGRLIMAVGVSSVHGTSDIRLIVPSEAALEGGVLTLDLMGRPPIEPVVGGSDQSREVTTAVVLTEQEMAGVRTIRVKALTNSLDRRAR
jgi:hypothetical protein